MFRLNKPVFMVAATLFAAGFPLSTASAMMPAARSAPAAVSDAPAALLHKVGMQTIGGAYIPGPSATPGAVTGQNGHRPRAGHGMHRRGGWFAGKRWFSHRKWFAGKPRRAAGGIGPVRPELLHGGAAHKGAVALTGKHATTARPGRIAGNNRKSGVTLPQKALKQLVRDSYPVSLKPTPRIRHVKNHRQHVRRSAANTHVRWSIRGKQRNAALVPYIRRY